MRTPWSARPDVPPDLAAAPETARSLEEAGYAVSSSEGNKKVFSITEAGKAHLEENREMIDSVLDHLERFGRKMAAAREWSVSTSG